MKQKGQVRTSIGSLLVGNRLTSDPAELCEELGQQYSSVFSEPVDVTEQTSGSSDCNSNMRVMDNIIIAEIDFIEAVKEVSQFSTWKRWHTCTFTEKNHVPPCKPSVYTLE